MASMMDYAARTAEYEKHQAELNARLDALENSTECVHKPVASGNQQVRVSRYLCKMCFIDITYEDAGTCRLCRTKLARQAALAADREACIRFKMKTTGSVELDDAIIKHAGRLSYS